ncbi:MAG: HupE/UreJ family protein [Myxococcota bacterium]
MRSLLFALLVLLLPRPAYAHLVSVRFGDFFGGALHVLSGLEHALVLLALGLLAGLQPREVGRWMLGAVPIGLALGGILAAAGFSTVSVQVAIVASLIVLGGLTAGHAKLPQTLLIALGLIAGALVGFENGLAMTERVTVTLFVAGVTVTGLVVVTPVTAAVATATDKANWAAIAVRSVASWLTAVGLIMIALVLRPH